MKWTIQELKKKQYQDDTFDVTLDYSSVIENDPEIIKITPVKVKGSFEIEDDLVYYFDLSIETTLTMPCAITLDPVEVPLKFDVTETFTTDPNDEFRQIEGITIDLLPIIWSNIYLEKPLRVVKENATFDQDTESVEKDGINPAFKDLHKYKN